MAVQVVRMLRQDQLGEEQAKYQQRGYEFMLHGHVLVNANHARVLDPTGAEKLAHGERYFHIGGKQACQHGKTAPPGAVATGKKLAAQAFLRLATPTSPSRPEQNSHAAAGTGTGPRSAPTYKLTSPEAIAATSDTWLFASRAWIYELKKNW